MAGVLSSFSREFRNVCFPIAVLTIYVYHPTFYKGAESSLDTALSFAHHALNDKGHGALSASWSDKHR